VLHRSIARTVLYAGECKKICDTAEKVGLARESLSRALRTPHIAEYLRRQTARRLAIAAARAGAVKGELPDSDNEMVHDRASIVLLGLAKRRLFHRRSREGYSRSASSTRSIVAAKSLAPLRRRRWMAWHWSHIRRPSTMFSLPRTPRRQQCGIEHLSGSCRQRKFVMPITPSLIAKRRMSRPSSFGGPARDWYKHASV
jgi:hypothetical protein